MRRGAKLTLASVIVLGGVVGAALFRKSPQSPSRSDSARPGFAASGTLPPVVEDRGAARLSGQIDPVESSSSPAAETPANAPAADPFGRSSVRREPVASDWQQAVTSSVQTPPLEPDAPAPSRSPAQFHRVRDGDTLSSLARHYLGSSKRFMEIYEANLDRLTSPDLLPIGAELKIPPADAPTEEAAPASSDVWTAPMAPIPSGARRPPQPAPAASGGVRTYHVKAGDTLAAIAEQFYGDPERYRDIYQANRQRLKEPADLREGLVLTIP